MTRKTVLLALLLVCAWSASGQKYPERSRIRTGEKAYRQGDFPLSERYFLEAIGVSPESYEARFNLAGAVYQQERYDEAEQMLMDILENEPDPDRASTLLYNLGNSLFQQQKYAEALEAYKNSLRIRPDDEQTKFNLAFTQKMLENDDPDDGGGDGNDDNSPDGDGENDPDNNGENDPDNDGENDPDNDGENDSDQDDEGNPPPEGGMTREEAENLLDAMQNSEDNTRDKMEADQAVGVGASGKNW